MKTIDHPIVIVGGGMTGTLAALFIKKREPRAEVILVERSGQVGGSYRGVHLPGFGYCDRAMRLIYETGLPEFDSILHGLLPPEEWHVLADNVKDVVGAYWRGQLQKYSPYLDLRRLEEPERRACERELLERLRHSGGESGHAEDASQYLRARFGPTAGGYVEKVLEKFYCMPASDLHETATYQPAMNRVILYGEDEMGPVMRDEKLRALIAWPDQLTLPVKRQPSQSGLYPRRFGINRVIDAAFQQLQDQGVRLLLNRGVASLKIDGDAVTAVTLDDGTVIENPALLIGANGLHGSLSVLRKGNAPEPAGFTPPRCWQVFLRVTERPNMDGLYHFWCFDETCRTFRVTSYANYCPDAKTADGYPLCVEVWSSDAEPRQAIHRAVDELGRMNIISGHEAISAWAAIPAMNMHGLCTMEHVRRLRAMRQELKELSPANMITVGPFIEDGVMLLYEVCRKMCTLISQRL
ncbi:MAG TPA: NAD(P)-binding protein [Clostridia bacterium]|nr:NAD(P)-binding protein [Clostridia bacterium]